MPQPHDDASVTWVLTLSLPYEHQEVVLSRLAAADASFWSLQPGFVSSRRLRGLDGTRVACERTFGSRGDYESAAALEPARAEASMLARFAGVDSRLYEEAR